MSYATMDHAEWVEVNLPYMKKALPGGKRVRVNKGIAGAPDKLSEFQAKVMDILGMSYGGIYNAPVVWDGIDWAWGTGIAVPVKSHASLATWDFCKFTWLVFLCCEARIRLDIDVHSPGHLKLIFHPQTDGANDMNRHPNLDEMVQRFRKYLPAEHRIIYRAAPQQDAGQHVQDVAPTEAAL